ncbi:MAG: hypothetical protein ACYS5V_14230, partial [Planctomycetota bacterium]
MSRRLALTVFLVLVLAAGGVRAELPVPGAVLHLDVQDMGVVLSDGDPVSSWADLAGGDNNAVQTDPLYQPIYVADARNGLAAVEFANDSLSALAVESWTPFTGGGTGFAVVNALAGATAQGALWRFGNTASGGMNYHFAYGGRVYDNFGLEERPESISSGATPGWAVYEVTVTDDGGGLATQQAWFNGMAGSPNSGTLGWTATPMIGNKAGAAANELNGQIAEVVLYDQTLSDADRNAVAKHLANKYGIGRYSVVTQQDPSYLAFSASEDAMLISGSNIHGQGWVRVDDPDSVTGTVLRSIDESQIDTTATVNLEFTHEGRYWPYYRCKTTDTDGSGDTGDNNDGCYQTVSNLGDGALPAFQAAMANPQFIKAEEWTWYPNPRSWWDGGWKDDVFAPLVEADDVGVVFPYSIQPSNPGPEYDVVIWHTNPDLTS